MAAFNQLLLDRRGRDIRVAAVVAGADIGRSTFYEHYGSIDRLFRDALKQPFGPLADAAAGRGDEAALAFVLGHFWDQRHHARERLAGRAGEKALQLLAEMVEERLEGVNLCLAPRLASQQLAGAALMPIRAWLLGSAACRADDLAASICAGGHALAERLASAG